MRRKFMSNKFHQISFKEIFSDCQDMFIDDVPSFFDLLEEHLDISSFIPDSFFSAFYRSLGRKRVYPLIGFLSTLILQKIFSIPTDSMLIIFLNMWLQKSMQQCKKRLMYFSRESQASLPQLLHTVWSVQNISEA